MCGPPSEECYRPGFSPEKEEKEDEYKGECRRCGAPIDDCDCWDHYAK